MSQARLSVNINKVALIRNSRGGDNPNVIGVALDCERFGADGITVHPRPDERHIRYADVRDLSRILKTEFNIEGNPHEEKFVELVLGVKPAQVTLVPDDVSQLTSNHGWDTRRDRLFLTEMVSVFKSAGIRVSLFVDPIKEMVEGAQLTRADRIELYTEAYARGFAANRELAIMDYVEAAQHAKKLGMGVNAGHDLNLDNLNYFAHHIDSLSEVSIGHALVADSLYFGLENTIQLYKARLSIGFSNSINQILT